MKKKDNRTWLQRFYHKYRFVIYSNDTFEEKKHFKLSRFQVVLMFVFGTLFIVGATVSAIVYTPLKEYIPGYTDVTLDRRVYDMERRTDSLERIIVQQDLYIQNFKLVIAGYDFADDSINSLLMNHDSTNYLDIYLGSSTADSIFRTHQQLEGAD